MAEKTGYSPVDISKLLQFQLKASTEVKESVAKGEIDINPAIRLVKESGSVTNQNETLRKGKEKSGQAGKVKAKHVLNKSLSPWDKFCEVKKTINEDPFCFPKGIEHEIINSLFSLLNDNKLSAEDIVSKILNL